MSIDILKTKATRRRFLQASGATGALAAGGVGLGSGLATLSPAPAEAQAARGATTITKSICHQCPARCGIDIYTTNGRVHAIYGNLDHPIANGKLCPKGHLGTYITYDPDRFHGPMKRTNPNKGRDQDPGFVPISWDEALDTIAGRLKGLRERGEAHRFALLYGRGWGASCAGLQGDFGKLLGSPNVAIGHGSMCAEGMKRAKKATDGNDSYSAYDYDHTNYMLIFGAGFLEAFRPYNNNMQAWGRIRTKSPKTHVTVIDVRLTTTGAAADRLMLTKPATDGAIALAIAHVMLTEGLWDKEFVGDFTDGRNRFEGGRTVPGWAFEEKWTQGLIDWWNNEVKDRTPAWAAEVTGLREQDILAVAREFGTTRPAMALGERGPTAHTNGVYNGMAIHALNALSGSLFAEGGLFYQMGPSYGGMPISSGDYMDDLARAAAGRYPRIDMAGTEEWPMAGTMMQEVAKNHKAGAPYKLDTMMFYLTNPVFTAPDTAVWEEMMKEVFVIDTSPFPGETAMFADIIVPDTTYLERLGDAPTYPFQGWPLAQVRSPAIPPVYDVRNYGDILIGIGKRMGGSMAEYYNQVDSVENVLRHMAKGFESDPGDNGVNSYESWIEKGVWYKKPYLWRQRRGEFYEWDGQGYNTLMTPEEVASTLIKTPSGKFEFKSGFLESHADYINRELGVPQNRVGYPQYIPARHTGGGDLHLVTPKTAMHAEGRGGNLPHAIALIQPTVGGYDRTYVEIHPETARARGIGDGDRVKLTSDLGSVYAFVRYYPGSRPDTLVLPMEHGHWAQGRWAKGRGSDHTGPITANVSDPISGLACYYTGTVRIERA